jgi:hypothetical protein
LCRRYNICSAFVVFVAISFLCWQLGPIEDLEVDLVREGMRKANAAVMVSIEDSNSVTNSQSFTDNDDDNENDGDVSSSGRPTTSAKPVSGVKKALKFAQTKMKMRGSIIGSSAQGRDDNSPGEGLFGKKCASFYDMFIEWHNSGMKKVINGRQTDDMFSTNVRFSAIQSILMTRKPVVTANMNAKVLHDIKKWSRRDRILLGDQLIRDNLK